MKPPHNSLRQVSATAVVVIAWVTGCGPQSQRGVSEAFVTPVGEAMLDDVKTKSRAKINSEVTPLIVASVVGEFAPGGGPGVLNGLLADALWDDRLQTVAAESEPIQDIFPRSPLKSVVNVEK